MPLPLYYRDLTLEVKKVVEVGMLWGASQHPDSPKKEGKEREIRLEGPEEFIPLSEARAMLSGASPRSCRCIPSSLFARKSADAHLFEPHLTLPYLFISY